MHRLALIAAFLGSSAHATKYPNYYWDAQGIVRDWKTKAPVVGASVLIFLDGGDMHQGWNAEQGDYPDLPTTRPDGSYFGTAVLFRSPPKERPEAIEVLVLAKGYRTTRQRFKAAEVKFVAYTAQDPVSKGLIELPPIELASYDYLASQISSYASMVQDSAAAARVARACVKRSGRDVSLYEFDHPEVLSRGRAGNWGVLFHCKSAAKGCYVQASLDNKTGRCELSDGK